MKKTLSLFFALCLLTALLLSLSLGCFAAEEKVDVIVGQKYEWNEQSETKELQSAWRKSKGISPDGLWKYQFYVLSKGIYYDMMHAGAIDSFGVAYSPGTTGVGYARVGQFGKNFHPAETADVAKVFTFPSGGTVTVDTTVVRVTEWLSGTGTPTSIAFYLDDKLVYPASGEYLPLTSTTVQNISFDLEVAQNQRLYIRIGSVNGDPADDSVDMTNSITYKAVNESSVEEASDATLDYSRPTNTISVTLGGGGGETSDLEPSGGSNAKLPVQKEDSGSGLLIGCIVGGVVVVAAIAVIIVLKKKKS